QSVLSVLPLWIKRNGPLECLLGRFRMLETKQGRGEVAPCVERIGVYDSHRLEERRRFSVFPSSYTGRPLTTRLGSSSALMAAPFVVARCYAQCSMLV